MKSMRVILWMAVLGTSPSALTAEWACSSVFEDSPTFHRHTHATVDQVLSQISQQAENLALTNSLLSEGQSRARTEEEISLLKDISRSVHIIIRALEDLAEMPSKAENPLFQNDIANLQRLLLEIELSFRSPRNASPALTDSKKPIDEFESLVQNGILDGIRFELMKDPTVAARTASRQIPNSSDLHSEEKNLLDSYSIGVYETKKTEWLNQYFKQSRFQDLLRHFQRKDTRGLSSFDRFTISIKGNDFLVWHNGVPQNTDKAHSLLGEYLIVELTGASQNRQDNAGPLGNTSGWEGLVVSQGHNTSHNTYEITLLTPEGKLYTFAANKTLSLSITHFRKNAYNFHRSYKDEKIRLRRVVRARDWSYSAPIEGWVIANSKKSLTLKTSQGEIIEIPTLVSETEWLEIKIL